MLAAFSFDHGGRTYSCRAEGLSAEGGGLWWWFTVSRDDNRYAPFQVSPRDTRSSVQERIVAYYTRHLQRRAEPAAEHWAVRGRKDGKGAGVAAAHRARIAAAKAGGGAK